MTDKFDWHAPLDATRRLKDAAEDKRVDESIARIKAMPAMTDDEFARQAPLTDAELAALQAVAEAATPGPWRVEEGTTLVWGRCEIADDGTVEKLGVPILHPRDISGAWTKHLPLEEHKANVAFVAAFSPATALRLLKEHREMAAERDRWRDTAQKLFAEHSALIDAKNVAVAALSHRAARG